MRRLQEALSAKERAEMLLSNLEKLKTEGTLEDDEYAHLKLEYSNLLTQASSQVEQIRRELGAQVVASKREADIYRQELKNLETRFKVGEIDATGYSRAAEKTQRAAAKIERLVAEMETLRGASSAAELGGTSSLRTATIGAGAGRRLQFSPPRVDRSFSVGAAGGPITELVGSFEELVSPRSKLVAPIAGFFLFVSVFLRWVAVGNEYYGVSVSGSSSGGLLAMTILAFLISTLATVLVHPKARGGIQLFMGVLAIIVAVSVIFGGPSFRGQGYSIGTTLREGFCLYMLAAVIMCASGLTALLKR